jgi:putative ABC transport system permease protein
MILWIRLVFESFRFAWNALRVNLLRTVLSLLGVTIGIFAIIAVFTIVDSLERSIKNSISFLGTNVIHVQKWPNVFDGPYPWWKYLQRSQPNYEEYRFLAENLKNHEGISLFAMKGNSLLKRQNNSINGMTVMGVSYGHSDVFTIDLENGRYFTPQEIEAARNVAIIGFNIKESLFPNENTIGKEIKIKGLNYVVIGELKKEGANFIGAPSNDDNCYIPYKSLAKLYTVGGKWGLTTIIGIQGLEEDEGLVELESEIIGYMRGKRGLKPREEDDFAVNHTEAIANQVSLIFGVITLAGWVIGGFSILVGGFGIANIMFVSVKERTNLIGIQKSLGAKNYFILFQFLFEAVFLSLIGGSVGIFLVFLLTFIPLGSLEVFLSFENIILGLGVSSIVGTISGILPAAIAARMDPVTAIRMQ